MKHRLIAALAATLFACACTAEQAAPDTSAPQSAADANADAVSALLNELDFSGAILVSKDGDMLMREAVNASPIADAETVTVDTRFPIASMTKSFTAALVLKLLQKNSTLS